MKLLTLDEVRKIQVSFLQELDVFCRKHNLTYFLYYGSLLGAIRHRGMIPWDNDIDVAMPREDYDRMIEMMREEDESLSFRFLCHENYPEYLWQHGRVSLKNTFMKTAGMYSLLGLSIDIFPLDNQGETEDEAKELLAKINECDKLRVMAYEYKYKTVTMPKDSPLWQTFEQIGGREEKYWVEKEIELSCLYRENIQKTKFYGSNTDGVYCIPTKREYFSGVEYVEYEGAKFPVPFGWDEILKAYYKNYMQLPPENERNKVASMRIYLLTEEEMKYALSHRSFTM